MSTAVVGTAPDRFAAARSVADAVLYEGYVLYPYRASSRKNQVRFQFGVLTPRAFSDRDGSERCAATTECLIEAAGRGVPVVTVRIRCLQAQHRSIETPTADGKVRNAAEIAFAPVDRLEVEGQIYVVWDEAVDQVIELAPLELSGLETLEFKEGFTLSANGEVEEICSREGTVVGRIVRRREAVSGCVRVVASHLDPGDEGVRLTKVAVIVENTTWWDGSAVRRDEIMGHSLIAVHMMLAVEGGRFISLLEAPVAYAAAVASCRNDGVFPVLIGADDVMLSSPIILYDHPEVAPESPGDLYDSTEIDEILALRVMTLTDAEKSEARGTDPRAAAIIDRCDEMTPEAWERLHGAVRPVRSTDGHRPENPSSSTDDSTVSRSPVGESHVPWWDPLADAAVDPWSDSVSIGGVDVHKGTAVRLEPSHRSDAQDLFLRGLDATVAGVFTDVDGSVQVAVTVNDDPATEELAWQGRYLFFHPDEIDPVEVERP